MDTSKYRHIIWDWNGTLIDDAWACVEILNKMLAHSNKPLVTLDDYRREFCFPVKDYYELLGFDFSVDSFEEIAVDYISEYDTKRFQCDLHNDAIGVLEAFARAGLSQSILSACQQQTLVEMVDHFGINRFFTHLAGLGDFYANGKIDRAKELLKELKIDGNHILLIGDTLHDLEVADAIGAQCVLVTNGHACREKLQRHHTPVVDSLDQLLDPAESDQ